MAGVSILSLGVRFQMFNAAFLIEPVEDERDLDQRIATASVQFSARGLSWSFWLCDGYLPPAVQKSARKCYSARGLRLASQMPGMTALNMMPPTRDLPVCELRPAVDGAGLDGFRVVGAECFRVPPHWFAEVFDNKLAKRPGFHAWTGFVDDTPVASIATVVHSGAIGVYNVATVPAFRSRGYAEAVMRKAIHHEREREGNLPIVLQSTVGGLTLYEKLGFIPRTKFRVWIS